MVILCLKKLGQLWKLPGKNPVMKCVEENKLCEGLINKGLEKKEVERK